MTAAQNKARERFKAAVKEAAKLRKANPKLSQADAVKQAFAQLYGKKKTGKKVGDFTRSGTKVKDKTGKTRFKKPDYSVSRTAEGTYKKWTKVGAAPKKSAIKKPSSHSDSKSHNVNIRVMSGINGVLEDAQKRKSDIIKRISKINLDISDILDNIMNMTPIQKGRARAVISLYKKSISNYKKEIKNLDSIISAHLSKQ